MTQIFRLNIVGTRPRRMLTQHNFISDGFELCGGAIDAVRYHWKRKQKANRLHLNLNNVCFMINKQSNDLRVNYRNNNVIEIAIKRLMREVNL